jgi:hypothetical protein
MGAQRFRLVRSTENYGADAIDKKGRLLIDWSQPHE